jgi:hypothetical protein
MTKRYLGMGILLSMIFAVSGCSDSTQTTEVSSAAIVEESESVGESVLHLGTEILDWEYAMENLHQGTLYIAKRMETEYEDTVLGAVEKELDHLIQTEESQWAVCDIEYQFDTPIPGKITAILRADDQDPFPEKGMYELNYIVLEERQPLISDDGFTREVPVYYMVSDMQAFYDGYNAFQANKALQDSEKATMENLVSGDSHPAEETEAVETVETAGLGNTIDASEYMLPYSNTRYLTEEDIAGMSKDEIRIVLNEIYARHGRTFQSEDLNAYFLSKSWYEPKYSAEEFSEIESSIMNDYEKKNIEFLAAMRDGKSSSGQAFEEDWMYGMYYLDLGEGGITAEIGYYTDSGEDYLSLYGSYLDSSGEFSGTILHLDDGTMLASSEFEESVRFEYNGKDQIEILSADNTGGMDFPGFEGVYQKTEDFPR